MSMREEITNEFPLGKEKYCPRCYFEDDEVVLINECKHSGPKGVTMFIDR